MATNRQRIEIGRRPLNAPKPLDVRADDRGRPLAMRRPAWPRFRTVEHIRDHWRIDDEWWRQEPISRLYYELVLEDGALLTAYRDLVADAWFEQRYHQADP